MKAKREAVTKQRQTPGVDWNLVMKIHGVETVGIDWNRRPEEVNKAVLALHCLERTIESGARFMMNMPADGTCRDFTQGMIPFDVLAGGDMSGEEIECPFAVGALALPHGIDFEDAFFRGDGKAWRGSFRRKIAEIDYWRMEFVSGWRRVLANFPNVDRAERRNAQAAFEQLATVYEHVLQDGEPFVGRFTIRLERFQELFAAMMLPDGVDMPPAVANNNADMLARIDRNVARLAGERETRRERKSAAATKAHAANRDKVHDDEIAAALAKVHEHAGDDKTKIAHWCDKVIHDDGLQVRGRGGVYKPMTRATLMRYYRTWRKTHGGT